MYEMVTGEASVRGVHAAGGGGAPPVRAAPAAAASWCPISIRRGSRPSCAAWSGCRPIAFRAPATSSRRSAAPRVATVPDAESRAHRDGRGAAGGGDGRARGARSGVCLAVPPPSEARDAEVHAPAAPIGRRARLPERVRAAGCGLALDRVLRDADDGAGRGRAAAHDPGRERRAHEDGAGARRRRYVRARHARADPGQPRHRRRGVRLVCDRRRPGLRAPSVSTPACRTRGRARSSRSSARPVPRRTSCSSSREPARACASGWTSMRCRRRRLPRSRPRSRPAPTRRGFYAEGLERLRQLRCAGRARPAGARGCRRRDGSRSRIQPWRWRGRRWATTSGRAVRVEPGVQAVVPVCRARNGCRWKARIGRRRRSGQEAIEIYQTLFRFFPDNLEYGLRLANAREQLRRAEATRSRRSRRCASPRRTSDPRHRPGRGGGGGEHLGLQTHAGGGRGRRGTRQGAGRQPDCRPRGAARRARRCCGSASRSGRSPSTIRRAPTYAEAGDRGRLAERAQQPGVRAHRSRATSRAAIAAVRRSAGHRPLDRPPAAWSPGC